MIGVLQPEATTVILVFIALLLFQEKSGVQKPMQINLLFFTGGDQALQERRFTLVPTAETKPPVLQ